QGMAHSLRHIASLRLMCDPRDLGSVAEVRSVTTRLPTVTVFEVYPGGVGFAARMYELHRELLDDASALVRDCPCAAGCPACVDTETTGLAGGAGTYVFTASVATPCAAGLRLAQFFLPEPGMEAAFLHVLRDEVEQAEGVATFNGGSFDLPILRTRWVMARM